MLEGWCNSGQEEQKISGCSRKSIDHFDLLSGGLKDLLFSPGIFLGEMIQFDLDVFF